MKILFFTDLNFWGEKIKETGLTIIPLFKKIPFILKPLRIFHLNNQFPFKKIWYKDWENQLNNFDLIILTAGNFTVDVANYIENLNLRKDIRLIFWYWDPVRLKYSPDKVSNNWEKWSFDKSDCLKYNLKYNSTYFFDSIQLPIAKLRYDVFFIGQNKGRLKNLLDFKYELEKSSLNVLLKIISDRKFFYDKKIFDKKLSYRNTLSLISQSKSILEIVQENQSGLTLRSMEALFFNKKLLTNNASIKNYDLYSKENIFIIGEDDINRISEFVNTPFKILDKDILEQYDFKEWLKRIINNIEFKA